MHRTNSGGGIQQTKNRLVTIAREEGVRALWKGFVPKVLRLAPGGGVLLLVVEVVSEGFRKCECPLASAQHNSILAAKY